MEIGHVTQRLLSVAICAEDFNPGFSSQHGNSLATEKGAGLQLGFFQC